MSVPESKRSQGKLEVITKTLDLATYTLTITSNKKIFKPEYDHSITDKLNETATNIFVDCWTANNVRVITPEHLKVRTELQQRAARNCNVLLALIQLAKKLFHLDTKRVRYWGNKILDCRNLIRAWREADIKRYDKP